MKSRLLLIVLTAGTCSSSFADFKSDCQKRLDVLCTILSKKDIKGLDKWSAENLAPDFRFIGDDGRPYFLKDWLGMQKQSFSKSPVGQTFKIKIDSVVPQGIKALVKTTAESTMTVPGKQGKSQKVTDKGLLGFQMIKKNGKWLIFEIKTHRSS